MIYRMPEERIKAMLLHQIDNFYFKTSSDEIILDKYFDEIMSRVSKNFAKQTNKYYSRCAVPGDETTRDTYFDPLHTCQWFIFLYYAANTIFKADKSAEAVELCDKIYGVSKIISSADVFYQIDLPEFFACDHPMGTVLGRAVYGNGFLFLQGCTVGNNHGKYPVIGENVHMYSDTKILGDCHIGNNVLISANTYIKDQDVPDDVIVFGKSPDLIFKKIHK